VDECKTLPPASSPTTASTPKNMPVTMGAVMTSAAGGTISRRLASVEILMHRAWSGGPCPGVPQDTAFAVFQGTSNGGQRCANLRP